MPTVAQWCFISALLRFTKPVSTNPIYIVSISTKMCPKSKVSLLRIERNGINRVQATRHLLLARKLICDFYSVLLESESAYGRFLNTTCGEQFYNPVCLSVRPSICPPVTPSLTCSFHQIFTKFARNIPITKYLRHVCYQAVSAQWGHADWRMRFIYDTNKD